MCIHGRPRENREKFRKIHFLLYEYIMYIIHNYIPQKNILRHRKKSEDALHIFSSKKHII